MDIDQAFQLAQEYLQKGNLLQAENMFGEILKIQPNNITALHSLGIIYYQLGKHVAAIEHIKKALRLDPYDSMNIYAYYILGNIFQYKSQFDEAITYYQKALQLNPDFAEAYLQLGNLCKENKQFDKAILYYKKATEFNPNLSEAYSNLGNIYKEKGQHDKALTNLLQVLQLNATFTEAEKTMQDLCIQGTISNKFISSTLGHHIYNMKKFLDIEFSFDFNHIINSKKLLILWNPYGDENAKKLWNYFRQNNLPSYCVERGAVPNTVFIDKNGLLCDSSSYNEDNWNNPLTLEQDKKISDYITQFKTDISSLEWQNSGRISKEDFFEKLGLDYDKRIIFVPLQLEGDIVIRYWSDWVNNVEGFQKIIVALSKKNKDKIFIVKNHPLSHQNKMISHENIKIVDDFHYKDCIEYSDCIITINSGLGLQAMIWKKPVIIVGKAFYRFDNINVKVNDFDELHYSIQADIPIDYEKVKRFLYFLKFIFYSDCELIKTERTRFQNATDYMRYINIRIF
jgi:tetratricopeptide (TPR) repeat protein